MKHGMALTAIGFALIATAALVAASPAEEIDLDLLRQTHGGNPLLAECPWSCNKSQTTIPIAPPIGGGDWEWTCIGRADGDPCLVCSRQAIQIVNTIEEYHPGCGPIKYQPGQVGGYDCGEILSGVCSDQACNTQGSPDHNKDCMKPRPPGPQPVDPGGT